VSPRNLDVWSLSIGVIVTSVSVALKIASIITGPS